MKKLIVESSFVVVFIVLSILGWISVSMKTPLLFTILALLPFIAVMLWIVITKRGETAMKLACFCEAAITSGAAAHLWLIAVANTKALPGAGVCTIMTALLVFLFVDMKKVTVENI